MDRFGIPNPRKRGSVIGAEPATVWSLLCVAERVPQGQTESGGLILAANAGPRVPSGDVTLKRLCTYRPSVIYLIVNKLLSLSLSLSLCCTRKDLYSCFRGGGESTLALLDACCSSKTERDWDGSRKYTAIDALISNSETLKHPPFLLTEYLL